MEAQSKGRRLAWIIGSLVLLGVTAEVFARMVLGLGHPPLSMPHPTIEYMFKPNQSVRRFGNLFTTNRYGMRSADFPPQKSDPKEFRVLVVGDSVVNGGTLSDQSHIATALLQQRLQLKMHRPVVVGNISAGSWGPPNELAYLKQYGSLDADVIILVLSSSDYDDAPTFEPLTSDTHPTDTPISALWEGIIRYLPRYLGGSPPSDSGVVPAVDRVPNKRDIELCLAAEREFFNFAKNAGAKILLVQHLTASELRGRRPLEGFSQLRTVAVESEVPVYDDAEVLTKYQRGGKDPFRDDIHLNDNGQQALAELLIQSIDRVP